MSENLLSFTNINLFGNVVKELDIVDPDKAIIARVATIGNTTLRGHAPIDGVGLANGNRVLVWEQANPKENGVYTVGAQNAAWTPAEVTNSLVSGSIVRAKEGTVYSGSNFQLIENKRITLPSTCDIILTNFTNNSSLDSISVAGDEILSTPLFALAGEILPAFSARVAIAINDDVLTGYTATASAAGVITVRSPLRDGELANGRVVQVNVSNMNAAVSGPMAGSAIIYRRIFKDIGKKRGGARRRRGENNQLEKQLTQKGACLARIYGFTFEGVFYDLQRPVVFLVHGEGEPANLEELSDVSGPSPSRAPRATSLTGLAAVGFDFADGLRVWSYDKADYTIRMDVETGMFEDVLLAAMLGGGPGGMDAAGMNARGMNARGMNARGMNARGMNARGMNARGGGNSD